MKVLLLLLCLLFIVYTAVIGLLVYGFSKVKAFEVNFSVPKTAFSIIIAFRNEELHLPELLQSLSRLNYPKDLFEIIMVDDYSADNSMNVISGWQKENPGLDLTVLQNRRVSNSPKKDAITTAISAAKYDWIITTDADCEVRENWLSAMNGYIETNPVEMIAGPVNFPVNGSFLSHFQQMDMLSLQGATIGSFGLDKAFMCNGANFAYTKQLFLKLGGFDGNTHISSGDDVFLLQKAMAAFPKKVGYLKSRQAIVTTKTEESWPALFRQRMRWASKATAYRSGFSKGLAGIVFMANLSIVCAGLFTVLGWMDWRFLLVLFSVKFTFDSLLMYKTNKLLRMCMHSVVLSSLAYPFFSTAVALYSLVGNFEWKGRKFKS